MAVKTFVPIKGSKEQVFSCANCGQQYFVETKQIVSRNPYARAELNLAPSTKALVYTCSVCGSVTLMETSEWIERPRLVVAIVEDESLVQRLTLILWTPRWEVVIDSWPDPMDCIGDEELLSAMEAIYNSAALASSDLRLPVVIEITPYDLEEYEDETVEKILAYNERSLTDA